MIEPARMIPFAEAVARCMVRTGLDRRTVSELVRSDIQAGNIKAMGKLEPSTASKANVDISPVLNPGENYPGLMDDQGRMMIPATGADIVMVDAAAVDAMVDRLPTSGGAVRSPKSNRGPGGRPPKYDYAGGQRFLMRLCYHGKITGPVTREKLTIALKTWMVEHYPETGGPENESIEDCVDQFMKDVVVE